MHITNEQANERGKRDELLEEERDTEVRVRKRSKSMQRKTFTANNLNTHVPLDALATVLSLIVV